MTPLNSSSQPTPAIPSMLSTKLTENKILIALGVLGGLGLAYTAYYFLQKPKNIETDKKLTLISSENLSAAAHIPEDQAVEAPSDKLERIEEKVALLASESLPQNPSLSTLESLSSGIKVASDALQAELKEQESGSGKVQEIEKRLNATIESKNEEMVVLLEKITSEIEKKLETADEKEALQYKKETETVIRIGNTLDPSRFIPVMQSVKKVKQSARKKITPISQSKKIELDLPPSRISDAAKEYKERLVKLLALQTPSQDDCEEMELLFVQISDFQKSEKSTSNSDDIFSDQVAELRAKLEIELKSYLNKLEIDLNQAEILTNEQFDEYLEKARKIRDSAISIQSDVLKSRYEKLFKETALIWHDQQNEMEVYLSPHWDTFSCPDPTSFIEILQPLPKFNELEQKKLKIESFLGALNLSTVEEWKTKRIYNRDRLEAVLKANRETLLSTLTNKWPSLLSDGSSSSSTAVGSANQGRRGVLASNRKK